MIKFLFNNWRSVFYSGLITLGFVVLIGIIENEPIRYYWYGVGILYLLLLTELFGLWFWSTRKLIQLNIPLVDTYDYKTQLILHVSLPSLLYIAIVGFIYNNLNPHLWVLFIIIGGISFFLLFTNIRSYYEDKFKLEQKTHFIYDFIKYFIFLLFTISGVEFVLSTGVEYIFIPVFIFAISLILIFLNILRYKFPRWYVWIVGFVGSLLLGLVAWIGLYYLNMFKLIFVLMLIFYMFTSIIHHIIKSDLTKDIVVEYLLVGLLLSSMFIF